MRSLKDKTIVVTGGAGFVGSHLVDRLLLEDPKSILVLDNFYLGTRENLTKALESKKVQLKRCDVADLGDLEDYIEFPVDVVFNLSVVPLPVSLYKPEWTIAKNIDMTLNLCELQRLGKFYTLVQFSSSEAYGTADKDLMDEDHPLNPCTPYAASKAAADLIALSYTKTFGTEAVVVRPFNQYGPRQNAGEGAAIIPNIVNRILNKKDIFIHGDGEQTRDFVYVTDTAEAAILAYKTEGIRGKTVNIASGSEVRMKDLVNFVVEYYSYPKNRVFHVEPRPGDVKRHKGGNNLAKQLLGWEPKIKFYEGLVNTLDWYDRQKGLV